jgi:hypothetical protein
MKNLTNIANKMAEAINIAIQAECLEQKKIWHKLHGTKTFPDLAK